MEWPPDYAAEFSRRMNLINRLAYDEQLRALIMQHYAAAPWDWMGDFCVTYDPRNQKPTPRLMPFVLFPKQVELVKFFHELMVTRESGLLEKARDMGASWCACGFSVWAWLYHEGTAIGWGSRKEDYVDKKDDPKAIFPKMRQIIEYLPRWMLPRGFSMDKHAPYMKIINPENGSTITGEAGDNIGRGGRTTMYFKDESAHYERPELIEAALGDNTDVQVDISSVNGVGNVFYNRRFAGEVWYPGHEIPSGKTRVFVMDWRDHPGKTQEWFDRRKKKAIEEGLQAMFAQEVERDYASSVERVIIPAEWARACVDAHLKLGIARDGQKVGGQDIADGGGDVNAQAMRTGVILDYLDKWGGQAGDAALKAMPVAVQYGAREYYYDSVGVGSAFKTEVKRMQEQDSSPLPPYLVVMPWNGGESVLDPDIRIIPDDFTSPTNADFYANLKAQAWWRLRTRIYKTWRAVTFGDVYPHDELISIDSTLVYREQLLAELSQATYDYNGKGKLLVNKTPDGTKSPNLADSVVICYCPTKKISSLDVL